MKTRASIKFGLVDVTAKNDSTLSVNDKMDFVDINDIERDNLEEVKYGTLEKNQFVLDGTFKIMPIREELSDMGWWSNSMSDENGDFATPLTLEVDFTEVHSSIGLSFKFSEAEDYCNHLNIKFYNSDNEIISDKDFFPNKFNYFCNNPAENYKKILVTFYSTNNPYRYLKLYKILYGNEVVFEGDNLIKASVLEEIDLLSNEISINTLDFTCYSQDDDFNILNPQGAYKMLQQRQEFKVTETFIKENTVKEIGSFYLDSWLSEEEKTMKFSAIDLIGIIDKTEFAGGMYIDVDFEDVINEIFTSANLETKDYEIQEELKKIKVTGYIPICTHRQALQQVIFGIGAVADCSRSSKIKIYKVQEQIENSRLADETNIMQGTKKIEQSTLVTGVTVTAHDYTLNENQSELFNNVVDGTIKVLFNEPVYGLTIQNGEILESSCNYALISSNGETEVILNGYKYNDDKTSYLVEVENLNPREKQKTLKIEDAYFINKNNAINIAQNVLQYYQKTYNTSFDILLKDESLADTIKIKEYSEQELLGQITRLNIDLTGGYIASARVNARTNEENENE